LNKKHILHCNSAIYVSSRSIATCQLSKLHNPQLHNPHHSSMFYPKFIIFWRENLWDRRLTTSSSSTAAEKIFKLSLPPLSFHHQRHPLQSSLFINSGRQQQSPFFPSINNFLLRLQSLVFDSSSQLSASLFFFHHQRHPLHSSLFINSFLFNLHQQQSPFFFHNQRLVGFLFSLYRKLFYL
jgi:hypothetical protein